MHPDDVEAAADAITARLMATVDPIIRRAVDEVMGERVTVVTETTVGNTTTTMVRSNRPINAAGPLASLDGHLDAHGIGAPLEAGE